MDALAVIESKIVHDVRDRLFQGGKSLEVDHLCFQCMEERLHISIVPAVPLEADARFKAQLGEHLPHGV